MGKDRCPGITVLPDYFGCSSSERDALFPHDLQPPVLAENNPSEASFKSSYETLEKIISMEKVIFTKPGKEMRATHRSELQLRETGLLALPFAKKGRYCYREG